MIGDSWDDVLRECKKDWRFRFHWYRLWPYHTLVILWCKFKGRVDQWLDLADTEGDEDYDSGAE